MTEEINFTYRSIENLCHICVDAQFNSRNRTHINDDGEVISGDTEKKKYYCYMYDTVFEGERGDEIIRKLLLDLFKPDTTITEVEIERLYFRCIQYIDEEPSLKELRHKAFEIYHNSWVYCKYDDTYYSCGFAGHTDVIIRKVEEYYKEPYCYIDQDELEKFIKHNFIVKSTMSTVENIAENLCRR